MLYNSVSSLLWNYRKFVREKSVGQELQSQEMFPSKLLQLLQKSTVTSSDFAGPIVSNPSKEFDILLVISWAFTRNM
ncbi:hypothetical protein NQ318_007684 [Aromia moschata]|uniref:Uncharacterized protein n=1 Tax=Aromia moschata TaxID=1265417 RepID=A0AAV8XKG0_9CUCU|nr:hypothetical protein NQ318_007684 [Aromia moschata]